jgi:hypothetical protein
MAAIKKFVIGEIAVRPPSTEVDAFVQKVEGEDGEIYLYLYNYAKNPGPTPTQTFRFDYTTAKAFKALIDEAFGQL